MDHPSKSKDVVRKLGKDCLELGFAEKDASGATIFPEEQLHNILNIDETCLSLDGSKGARGGRPEVIFFDPRFPLVGKETSKSGLTTTMIGGSTAAGEALPPHFQFQTSAQTAEREQMRVDMMQFVPAGIYGHFGNGEEKLWPVTFAMNAKGGMDDEEFEKYVFNSIVPLYPNAEDKPGKRVMIKVDSGPGRMAKRLLARLRLLGFILYPGVPNTTAVSQETDRNYGPFKTQFRKNLALVVDERIRKKKSVSLQPWLVVLIVFGGADPETKYTVIDCAYSVGFSRAHCIKAWKVVGCAPLTMKCLGDSKVRRELGDSNDQEELMRQVQDANNLAIYQLNQAGYIGSKMAIKLVPTKT